MRPWGMGPGTMEHEGACDTRIHACMLAVAGQGHPPGMLLDAARTQQAPLPQYGVHPHDPAGDRHGPAPHAQHAAGALRPQGEAVQGVRPQES